MPRNTTTTTTTTTTTIMIISSLLLLTLIVSLSSSSFIVVVHSFSLVPTITTTSTLTSTAKTLSTTTLSTTALSMAIRKRGLEQRIEGPTPTEDGMILYLKAGEDGKSVGDCPFGQNIRMILEEKEIKYDIRTCSTTSSTTTKPNWLIEYYDGQLPALRHKKECYIETNIIVSYLDYFFPTSENNDENISNKSQSSKQSKTNLDNAEENALGGFFPSIARYLKDVNDDDENENETLEVLKERLDSLENHFKNLCDENEDNDNDNENNEWCYLDGSKTNFSNLDCRIIPQLYHLTVAVVEFKNGSPNLKEDYPFTYRYLNEGMKRDSFINTKYSKETIVWGWNNARQQQQQSQQLQE